MHISKIFTRWPLLILRKATCRPPCLVEVGTKKCILRLIQAMTSAHWHFYKHTRRNKYTQNLQDYSRGFNYLWILKAAGRGGRVSEGNCTGVHGQIKFYRYCLALSVVDGMSLLISAPFSEPTRTADNDHHEDAAPSSSASKRMISPSRPQDMATSASTPAS